MPAIEPFYEIGTDHAKRIDSAGDQERTARKAEIDLLWRYYDGDHDEMLIVRPGRKNDNVTINLVGQAADDTVDFVGVPERMELPGGDEVSNVAGELSRVVTTEQETVDAIYEDHRQLMRDAVLSLLLAGHAFAKVHITEDGPTFDLVDPRMVTVYVDAFNPRRVVFYRMQWTVEPAGRFGKEIALRQDIVPAWAITASPNADTTMGLLRAAPNQTIGGPDAAWVVIDQRREGKRGTWDVLAVDWWSADAPPMVDRPVKRKAFGYYGDAPLRYANKLNDTYNLTMGNVGRILYWHAHPKTVFTGVQKGSIDTTSIDGAITLPKDANAFNVEMQSDLSSSMNYSDKIRAAFFTKAQVVDTSNIKDKVGQMTNFGLRLTYKQMTDMGNKIREAAGALFGDALRSVMAANGALLAKPPAAVWEDTLPTNRLELLQGLEIEQRMGFTSKQSLAKDAGRDFELEQDQMEEEQQTAGELLAGVLATVGDRGGDPFMRQLPSGNGNGQRPQDEEQVQ
jgi:hypothetical protein